MKLHSQHMELSNLKLAAYLDQISEDPINAIDILSEYDINNVILRRAWSKNICKVGDAVCAKIRSSLLKHDLKVILICSDIGHNPANDLMRHEADIDYLLTLAEFFGCQYIRLGIGRHSADPRAMVVHEAWMKVVDKKCMARNIAPCLEISHENLLSSPAEVASILHKYKRWKLIFDPAILIQTRKLDPFTKYWSLLKGRVSHIDIRDFKIGHAPVPPGHGDAKLDLILADAILSNYRGWYCLEPGLGRKHRDISGLDNVFKMSFQAFKSLCKRLDLGAIKN